jgi:hypothetical protein
VPRRTKAEQPAAGPPQAPKSWTAEEVAALARSDSEAIQEQIKNAPKRPRRKDNDEPKGEWLDPEALSIGARLSPELRAKVESINEQETGEPQKPLKNEGESGVIKNSKKDQNKVAPKFKYAAPDTEAELSAIGQRSSQISHVMHTVADLGLEGVDVQVQVAGLHEIGSRFEQLARDIGMHAVSEGRMTQVQLSRLIGVHELTVHRWVKALQKQQQEQPTDQENQ